MQSEPLLDVERYTVAWIAPLEIEARAARAVLDHEHQGKFTSSKGDNFIYSAGDVNGHNVVISSFPADHPYGTNSAASLASDLKNKFPNLWFGLLVGVAAGFPKHSCTPALDIRLGDVLVAMGSGDHPAIINYEFGKETADGFQLSPRGTLPRTEQIVRAAIGRIKSEASETNLLRICSRVTEKDDAFIDPGQSTDILYSSNGILLSRKSRQAHERTKVWYGTIGSGDKLVKDQKKRDELRDRYNVIGLEMEAAGVMNIMPVGVIRGVSDYGDRHKNKHWQPYAAITAAAYAKTILLEIVPSKIPRQPVSIQDQFANESERLLLQECLRSLSFPDIDNHYNTIAFAHENTCNWLFETSEFKEWQNRTNLPSHNGVLWIKGKPGSGKSTLMKHVLEHCATAFYDHVRTAFFFNALGGDLERTPLGMLRSILFQLVDQSPRIRQKFLTFFHEKQKKHSSQWDWHVGELKSFIAKETRASQSLSLVIFIDALDECTERDVRAVVSFLEELSIGARGTSNTVRICLSSRHYPTINMARCLGLDLNTQSGHDDDISKYIESKLKTTDPEIINQISFRAAHVFMWVVLVVEMLNVAYDEGREMAIRSLLNETPSDLENVYKNTLENGNERKQETLLLLQWVLFAEDMLSPEELFYAIMVGIFWEETIQLASRNTPEVIRRYITSTSRGLVEVRQGRVPNVQFIHYSVNDFLLRNKRLSQLDPALEGQTTAKCHARLAACCIKYLKACGMSLQYAEKYPFLKYALKYVIVHSEKAQLGNINQESFIHWLEHSPTTAIELLKSVLHDNDRSSSSERITPIYYFAASGCEALVTYCLQLGSDINAGGGPYGNSLQAASRYGCLKVIQLLIEKGADVNAPGGHYGTALHVASRSGRLDVVRLLIEKGADVNSIGGHYGSALQIASAYGFWDLAQFLVAHGADVNAQCGFYGTAFQAACAYAWMKIVVLLLNAGADMNVEGGRYGSAFNAARYNKNFDVVKLLSELKVLSPDRAHARLAEIYHAACE